MPSLEYQDRERDRAGAAMAEKRKSHREIGDWPAPVNPERRAAALASLRFFLKTYFPQAFPLPWSADHLKSIDRLERAIIHGGLLSWAMPRGSGKTVLCERAALWAILAGHRNFVCIVGATSKAAEDILEHIKTELTYNEFLREDFPKPCHAFHRLEGDSKKANGQICNGERTRITWRKTKLVFPICPGPMNEATGAVITVVGLTGAIRGQNHTRDDGKILRPRLVLLDDPQTRESAMSVGQSQDREAIVAGDVLGMAGPGEAIAAVMPCTVIRKGDMADKLLSRKLHPQWQSERFKLVYAWPTDEKKWEEYGTLRMESLINDGDGSEATDFYRLHRVAMDAGSQVAWEDRKNPDELSALQHAVNLRLRDPVAFEAEYQNDPPDVQEGQEGKACTVESLRSKCSGLARGVVPLGAQHLTSFIDVQQDALFWMVCAWADNGTGAIVDYGIYPEQGLSYITLAKLKNTLRKVSGASTVEAGIRAGLTALSDKLIKRAWRREDGAELKLGRLLVDMGYWTSTITEFCRRSEYGAVVMPAKGIPINAANKPIEEYQRKPGEKIGHHWMIGYSQKQAVRNFNTDVNWWKTFVHERLALPLGQPGNLSLFGAKAEHQMLSDHITAETCVKTEGRGRTVYQWTIKPGHPDNHFLDTLVGCAAAANELGVKADPGSQAIAKKARMKLSDIQRQRAM